MGETWLFYFKYTDLYINSAITGIMVIAIELTLVSKCGLPKHYNLISITFVFKNH